MLRLNLLFVSCLISVALTACGGGNKASTWSSPSSQAVTSALSFPFQSGLNASVAQGSSVSYTITGSCRGRATYTSTVPIAASFEGVDGRLSVTSTQTINFSDCTPYYISASATNYFDINYLPLGSSINGGDYGVFLIPPSIPTSVRVGDSGTLGTRQYYTDSSKLTGTGREVISYSIEPDTATTAIVNMINRSYSATGDLLATGNDKYRIMADGTLVPISSDILEAGSLHLILTVDPDNVAPSVVTITPANSSANIPTGSTVSATFSEAIDSSTLNTSSFSLRDTSGITVAGTVSLAGRTATFTPSNPLLPSTLYTASINKNVKDLAGNPLGSVLTWTFTTDVPDITPPSVISANPADAATGIAINSVIQVTFSEAMEPASIITSGFTVSNGATPVAGVISYSGNIATFTPSNNLLNGVVYTATISGAARDRVGNFISTPYTWSFTTDPTINPINFNVVDAEYSKALDRIVLVSTAPGNQLHIYDPVNATDTSVALNLPPTSVSVSPDGLFAAIGHNAWISYVDLSTATLLKTIPATADVSDIVLAGNGYAYAFPRVDQWVAIHAINLTTEVETLSVSCCIRAGTKAKLHPNGTSIYGANNGLSPSDIEKYDITSAVPAYLYNSPYHGDYAMCGDLWMSEDGLRIFTKCGNVFNSTPQQFDPVNSATATDMTYAGALPNLSNITDLSHSSATGKITAIPSDVWWGVSNADTEIRIFNYPYLTFDRTIRLPHFINGNFQFQGHGKFVFSSSDGTKTFVVLQAESGSGLLYDFGVVKY